MTDSMTDAVAARATVATRIIGDAGALALDYFRNYRSLAVQTKTSPQDIVSEADRQVESLIRGRLAAQFPDDGLVGEQHGHLAGRSGFNWLIDPIDGTSPFLHGLRNWCVVLALLNDDRPVLGLIYDPCSDELFSAIAGSGAQLNGQAIAVDPSSTLQQGLTAISAVTQVPATEIAGIIERLHNAGGAYIRLGSAALTLAYVAAGRLVGYYEPLLHAWDCVAGLLLVQEAGGIVNAFPLKGGAIASGPAFAASPATSADLSRLIQHPDIVKQVIDAPAHQRSGLGVFTQNFEDPLQLS